MLHDLKFALRTLAKSPAFAFVAIVSLALGIGANSTIFSLVRATVFPTLPFHDVGRLVDLSETSAELCVGCGVGTSLATYRDWKARTRTFASMGASREDEFVVTGADEAVRLPGALVSATLFPTLGVRPVLGRGFAADEDRPGARARRPALVRRLGAHVRRRHRHRRSQRYASTARPATVVGVMPRNFGFPEFAQMWAPIGAVATPLARDDRSVSVVARLAPTTTLHKREPRSPR